MVSMVLGDGGPSASAADGCADPTSTPRHATEGTPVTRSGTC